MQKMVCGFELLCVSIMQAEDVEEIKNNASWNGLYILYGEKY